MYNIYIFFKQNGTMLLNCEIKKIKCIHKSELKTE